MCWHRISSTYSLENCKHFEAKVVVQWMVQMVPGVPSTIPLGDSLGISPPSRDPPSSEVPTDHQSVRRFQSKAKAVLLSGLKKMSRNQPFIMFWCRWGLCWATQKPTGGTPEPPRNLVDLEIVWGTLSSWVLVFAGCAPKTMLAEVGKFLLAAEKNIKQTSSSYRLYIGLPPCPVIVTTRSCTFLVGNSFASFATVAGKGLRSQLYMLGWFLKRLQERVAAIVAIAFFIPILDKTHRQISRTADIFEVKLSFIRSKTLTNKESGWTNLSKPCQNTSPGCEMYKSFMKTFISGRFSFTIEETSPSFWLFRNV